MRWIGRGAVALGVGAIVALGVASPASAADTKVHSLAMGGTMRIVDFDSPDNDDICNRSTNKQVTLQYPNTLTGAIGWNNTCDEVRIKLRIDGSLNSSGTMTIKVTAELDEEDCTVWVCDWDRITTRTWNRTLATGATTTVSGLIDGGDEGQATVNLTLTNHA